MADAMKKLGGMGKKGLLRGGLGALFGGGGGMPPGGARRPAADAGRPVRPAAAAPPAGARPAPGPLRLRQEEMTAPVIETERLTLRPHAMADWEAMAAFFESDASVYVGGAAAAPAQLVRLRRRRRRLGPARLRQLGGGRERDRHLRRPGRPQPPAALSRGRDRLDRLSRLPAPRLRPRGRARRPRPCLRGRSAGRPPSATSTATTPPRSPSPRSIGCHRGPPAPRGIDPKDFVFRHPAPEARP